MNMQRNFGLTKLPIGSSNDSDKSPRFVSGWWIVPSLIISIAFFCGLVWLLSPIVE